MDPRKLRRRLDRRRLAFDLLEHRTLLDSSPKFIGSDPDNLIQIAFLTSTEQWTFDAGIYKTNAPVSIGFKPSGASYSPVLLLGNELNADNAFGVEIDQLNNRFVIKATQTDHNVLSYLPSGNAAKQAYLFEFVGDFTVQAETLLASPGITPSGLVLATNPENTIGIKVDNAGVLSPSTLQLSKATDLNTTTQIVMTGPMAIEATSKLNIAKKLLDKMHINISNDANANVTATAAGKVTLVSQTGSAILITIDKGDTFQLGPVTIAAKTAEILYDLKASTFAIAGQFEVGLGDDGADATPFLLDFGDTNRPGIVLDFSNGGFAVDSVYVAIQAGTNNGKTRSTLNLAGLQVSVNNLFILYDRSIDAIGIGGMVNLTIGEASDPTSSASVVTIKLGNATQDPANGKAGLFIKNGKVDSFSGEIKGFVRLRRVRWNFDVSATYAASPPSPATGPAASIWGNVVLLVNNPLNQQVFSMTSVIPESLPLLYKNGDWIMQGFEVAVSGEVDAPGGLALVSRNLRIGFADQPDSSNPTGFDRILTVSGGVSLPKLWNATVTFNDGINPGLIVKNGDVQFDGFQFSISDITIGGAVGLKSLAVNFERTNNGADWDLKLAGEIILPGGIELDASFELKDGVPIEIGVEYKATGTDPGIPVGDTGLFITDIGFELDDLLSADRVFEGEIGLGYGLPVNGIRSFNIVGHFKADRNEFDIVSADFQFLKTVGTGHASLELNWAKHEYKLTFDASVFYQIFDVSGQFELNPFGQITVYLGVGIRVPSWVPFIGGDEILGISGLVYYDPIVPSNTLVAGWIDIDFLFAHLRAGVVYYPNGPNSGVHFVTGDAVVQLENQATQNNDGYTTSYTTSISTQANTSLFTLTSNTPNVIGTVTINVPGVTTPVVINQGGQATSFSLNNVTYQAGLFAVGNTPNPPASGTTYTYSFFIQADPTANPYAYIPTGSYSISTLTAEPLATTLSHTESFAPPTVTDVVLAQPTNSNTVNITVNYGTGDPNSTAIDLMYTTDPTAKTGTRFQTLSLAGLANQGTTNGTLDLSGLTARKNYYVLARIYDPTNSSGETTAAKTSVTPYPTIISQLKITPDVPFDRAADTLSGWAVVWRRTDTSGVPDIRLSTDSFGASALTVAAGTYTILVSPSNWDGFSPLPTASQSSTPNGTLIQTGVVVGTPATPTSALMTFQNMISIHGLISEDLSGSGSFLPGGAGLSGIKVFNDLNNNGTLDPSEPHTMTDRDGYYDLRFPLPTTTTQYTIREVADGQVATYLRVTPDNPQDLTFRLAQPGVSDFYTISVNPLAPPTQDGFSYSGRDYLLRHPIIISGVGYVASPVGSYGPEVTPAVNKVIDLFNLDDNKTLLSTTTGPDGSYSFQVPKPGRWRVSTEDNNFSDVSFPGRHAFNTQLVNGSLNYAVPVTTPGGAPLYQLGETGTGPLIANGDFDADSFLDVATLAVDAKNWSATQPGNLYVVVYAGADLPSKVTAKSYLLASNVVANPDLIPSIYWSDALDSFVMATPKAQGGVIATSLFPDTGQTQTTAIWPQATVPIGPKAGSQSAPMTTLLGLVTSDANQTQTWLMASDSGREWMLLQYNDLGSDPELLTSFNFFTSKGVRPDLSRHATAQGVAGRWAALTTGDFDGDGIPDYAFSAVNGQGRQVVAYVVSKNNYASVETIQLGGAYAVSPNAPSPPQVFINSIESVPTSTSTMPGMGMMLDSLAVHRSAIVGSGSTAVTVNDMLIFRPAVATDQQVLAGLPSVSFAFQSVFPLQGGFSNDAVADINADMIPDLLTLDDQVLGVLLGNGDGSFQAPVYSPNTVGLMPGASGGLLSAGTFDSPVPCNSLPSILYVQQSQIGQPLQLQLVLNASFFSNSYEFVVESAGTTGGYNFGFISNSVTPADTFTGSVYADLNLNGMQDPGEPGLAGQTVQVVTYGAFGPNDPVFIKTGPDGRYSVTNDLSFEIVISIPGFKYQLTEPMDGEYDIVISGMRTGYDFGIRRSTSVVGSLQGLVYQATNPNGSYTPGDPGISGITVFVDVNGTGTFDAGDKSAVTDDRGVYSINGLTPGTYVVLQQLPSGTRQITGPSSVVVLGNQTTYAVNFGNFKSNLTSDFNNDGRPDYLRLVPVNASRTSVELDLMAADGVGRTVTIGEYDPNLLRPVTVGDFSGDGYADLLFQEQGTGLLRYWVIKSGRLQKETSYITLPTNERLVGVTDVDQQGTLDLVMVDRDTGSLKVWLMNGRTQVGSALLGYITNDQVLEGCADINGDGRLDLLVLDTRTQELSAHLITPGFVVRSVPLGPVPSAVHLVGVEPANNGVARYYWQNDASGQVTSEFRGPMGSAIKAAGIEALARTSQPGRYLNLREADTPLLGTMVPRTVTAGGALSFAVPRSAAGTPLLLRYALAPGAPEGATIDPASGIFTWSPPANFTPGVYTLRVLADVPALPGLTDARTLTIRVNAPAPPPSPSGFVTSLYPVLLNRSASPGETSPFVDQIQRGTPRSQIVRTILRSPEARGVQVDELYQNLFDRLPTSGERSRGIAAIARQGVDALMLSLLNSKAYRSLHPLVSSYIKAIYQDVLGRDASASEVAVWSNRASSGNAASAIVNSRESKTRIIDQAYQKYLKRPASEGDRTFWLTRFANQRTGRESLTTTLLGSAEYYGQSGPPMNLNMAATARKLSARVGGKVNWA